jgi:predicted RNA-binding protein with PUA-like domain
MRHWLMKSEPDVYPIEALERDGATFWEGVRNYQARNFMRDDMAVGDPVLFYHSNAEPPGVAGVAKIARTAYPDDTAWDPKNHYHDPSCPRRRAALAAGGRGLRGEAFRPPWCPLEALKANPALEGMLVTRNADSGSACSPSRAEHFAEVLRMAGVAFVATP